MYTQFTALPCGCLLDGPKKVLRPHVTWPLGQFQVGTVQLSYLTRAFLRLECPLQRQTNVHMVTYLGTTDLPLSWTGVKT